RFGEEVDGRRRAEALLAQVISLEDVEHLEECRAPGARRRDAQDLVAAVGATDRRAALWLVLAEVLAREDPARPLHLLLDQLGRRPLVEAGRSFDRDPLERPREVSLLQAVAGLEGDAVPRELSDRRRVFLHLREVVLQIARERRRDREAVAGE